MQGRDRSSLPFNTGNFHSKNSTRKKPSATRKARNKALAFPVFKGRELLSLPCI